MTSEQYPHTVFRWDRYMANHGVSNRPIPQDDSDFLHPETYPDPFDIKPERAALAGILAVRAYQRSKKDILERSVELSLPHFADLTSLPDIALKNQAIGKAFTNAMVHGMLADEQELLSRPSDQPAASVYHRLDDILQVPIGLANPKSSFLDLRYQGSSIKEASPIIVDLFGGIHALPSNMNSLLENTVTKHTEKTGYITRNQLIKTMDNSYYSYILPVAEFHKAASLAFDKIQERVIREGNSVFILTEEGSLAINPIIRRLVLEYIESHKENMAATTRCAFLTNPKEIEPFLDEPADFEDPLKDAFDLHMNLLAA